MLIDIVDRLGRYLIQTDVLKRKYLTIGKSIKRWPLSFLKPKADILFRCHALKRFLPGDDGRYSKIQVDSTPRLLRLPKT